MLNYKDLDVVADYYMYLECAEGYMEEAWKMERHDLLGVP